MRNLPLLAAALCLTAALPANLPARAQSLIPPAKNLIPGTCPSGKTLAKLSFPLARTSAKLRAGEPVTIVAIGSSSTAGAGSSSRDAAYPSRLQAMLRERFPGADIEVINRGMNGQDAPEMLARFDTDVAAYKPTLVIWQSGVNALFREGGLTATESLLREAIARVRALDADLVLVDPQYAPRVIADADIGPMIRLIDTIAQEEGIGVYHRFALMRDWHEKAGVGFEAFLWKDSFHMNDWGYDCFARDLGRAMAANIDAQQRSADVTPNPKALPASTPAAAAATAGTPLAPTATP